MDQLMPSTPRRGFARPALLLPMIAVFSAGVVRAEDQPWWPASAEQALAQAGDNRPHLLQALTKVPPEQRPGLQFLLANMPAEDLRTLSDTFLLENIAAAYDAWQKAPWKDQIPTETFLNEILPYACLNETRDASRQALHEKAAPLVADCKTPTEAARRLNEKLFGIVKVHYSTGRKRADQSPLESMESGIATCTGLSILLVDACRSVGIPARVVGTPLWFNQRGNHTWVEIWDGGWHFAGAAEPDGNGLDHGWFEHDAGEALKDVPVHAIYASSFQKTDLAFPMIWAPARTDIPAVNVTDRYTAKATPNHSNLTRLQVRIIDHPKGPRVAAQVTLSEPELPAARQSGLSKDETADTNNFLTFEVLPDRAYNLSIEHAGKTVVHQVKAGHTPEQLVEFPLSETP